MAPANFRTLTDCVWYVAITLEDCDLFKHYRVCYAKDRKFQNEAVHNIYQMIIKCHHSHHESSGSFFVVSANTCHA